MPTRHLLTTGVIAALALSACGSDAPTARPLSIEISDAGCRPASATAPAGPLTIAVSNRGTARAEFEIVSPTPQIALERFVDAGASGTYTLTLPAGEYRVICGAPRRGEATLTLTGTGGSPAATSGVTDRAALDRAVADYRAYVEDRVVELQDGVAAFTAAVRAGDTERAKALYPAVRVPWEAIEPVAELFPDHDVAIDSRADDHDLAEADPGFTGFHAIEYGLWAQGTVAGATVDLPALADRLDRDVAALVASVRGVTILPETMTGGAGALIEEAAQTKITGEEERYSHTDVATLAANVDGAKEIFTLLQPLLTAADGDLAAQLGESFAKVDVLLARYAAPGGGYRTYDAVTDADRATLKTAMAQLAEELARVTGTLGLVSAS